MGMLREDPLVGFHFSISVQGIIAGFFTEISGLGSETEVVEHKVVRDGKEIVMKIPGRLKWQDITMKRGITSDMDIWKWRKMVEDGNVAGARKDGTITMLNQQLMPVAEWNFERAWPVKISGPSLQADGNNIGIEELVIAHEYIERVK